MKRLPAVFAVIITVIVVVLAMQTQTFSRVDAGGPRVRAIAAGKGGPAVVFDTGGNAPLEGWGSVPAEVGKFTQTFAYDRPGNGLSDKSTTPRDARHIARELHTVLGNAQVSPPYILVGHSVGGPYVRVFADMFPQETAGLVLIDPTQEETMWYSDPALAPSNRNKKTCSTDEDERGCAAATLSQAHESVVPPGIPVFLIHVMYPWGPTPFFSSDREQIEKSQAARLPVRLKFHQEWVDRIPGARLIVTEKSSHGLLNFEEPELIVRTIRQAVELARMKK